MDSVSVPLRSSGKKMRKRRELDALVAHSLAKRACNSGKRQAGNGINSQDQLLSQSTDDQEEYSLSKIQISQRHRKHYSFLRTCTPLLFIISVFLLFSFMYWLHFDLREQLSDHRNKIEQVSAICLSMPETLQKLHESYKFLEQNQTAISQKIYEIQQRIESVEKEFLQFKENIRKKEDGPDGDKTVDVKDTVAGFGAKIQSLESDVKTLKDDFTGIQQTQQKDKDLLGSLRVTVDTIANSSQSSTATGTQNASNVWMRNFTDQCSNDLKNVSNQLAAINQTFSLKIKAMDDEMHDHQTKLDGLNESFANVSSHVTSIESEWPKFKQANQKYDSAIAEMINDIFTLKSSVVNISSAIHNVQSEQENANKKITNFANINDSVPVSASSQLNGSQPNLNDSKVTSFPDSLINPKDSATQQKSSENVSQPPQQPKSSATQSPSSSTTTPIHMAN